MHWNFNQIMGLLLIVFMAILTYFASPYLGLNQNLVAILLGFVISVCAPINYEKNALVIKWCETKILGVAVALLGAQLNINQFLQIKTTELTLMISSLIVVFAMTLLFAKAIKVKRNEALLIASGQGICGSAAVMAAHGVVKSSPSQVGIIVALVNFLGFLGVFISLWICALFFDLNDFNGGVMIGNTLQSMGHVVAAGFSINDELGQTAVLIKMGRIILLIPVLLLLIYFNKQATKTINPKVHWFKLIPVFIWVFILLSFMASMSWLPDTMGYIMAFLSDGLFLVAMVAIGMGIKISYLKQSGKLLVLATMVFLIQIIYSLGFLYYFQ